MSLSSRSTIVSAIVACLFFVLVRFWYYQPTFLETAASVVVYPFVRTAQAVTYPFRASYEYMRDVHASYTRYHIIKQQLINAQAELIQQYATDDYHKQIRELIEFEYGYDMSKAICAQVIARSLSAATHECFINAGLDKGVAVDMVAVFKNCLIGRVDQVYPLYSKIIFITDPRSKIGVYMHETQASGICEGTCDVDKLIVRYVNHLDTLKEGDMVISRGQGLVYPQGFALGTVSSYTQNGVEYECTITPLVKPSEVAICYLFAKG
jgi:rod shape-determining protein MreC